MLATGRPAIRRCLHQAVLHGSMSEYLETTQLYQHLIDEEVAGLKDDALLVMESVVGFC